LVVEKANGGPVNFLGQCREVQSVYQDEEGVGKVSAYHY